MPKQAVITAGGLGTRFLPASKVVPKELLPVVDKPVIQHVVEEAVSGGYDKVVIVRSPQKQMIEEHFAASPALESYLAERGKDAYLEAVRAVSGYPLHYVVQEKPGGLGQAIACAGAALEKDSPMFYAMLGDVIVPEIALSAEMERVSAEHGGANVIAVMPVPQQDVFRFGVIGGVQVNEKVWRISSLVEKPAVEDAPTNLVIFGRYLLNMRILDLLEQTAPGVGGEVQLTDALVALLAEQEIYAYVMDPSQGFDVGTVETWLAANVALGKRAFVL